MAEGDELAAPDPEPADPLVLVRQAARRTGPWIAGVVVVLAVLGAVFGARASWGDVATWALAVTGLLALVAAVFAGLVAYAVLAVEMRRDQVAVADRRQQEQERAEQREANRRAQAGRVAAWFGTWKFENAFYGSSGDRQPMPPSYHSGAIVRNGSDLPVYDVRASFCGPVPVGSGLGWRNGERWLSPSVLVVPPGEEHVALPDEIRSAWSAETADGREQTWLVAIEFTDADGRRWLRDPRGILTRSD